MSAKRGISAFVRRHFPRSWQRLKYWQYLISSAGEREIRIVNQFVDPGRSALDIGVHLGMYSRHLAKRAASVVGFEANPESAEFARRSLRTVATIISVGLSSKSGTAVLRYPVEGAGGGESALGTLSPTNALGGRGWREVTIQTRRLDDFQLPPVGFIKIDVEGYEEEVLSGAKRLLERDRPALMIEIEDRHNPGSLQRMVRRFKSCGYEVFFYDGRTMRDIAEFDAERHQCSNSLTYINNFFFVPERETQ